MDVCFVLLPVECIACWLERWPLVSVIFGVCFVVNVAVLGMKGEGLRKLVLKPTPVDKVGMAIALGVDDLETEDLAVVTSVVLRLLFAEEVESGAAVATHD